MAPLERLFFHTSPASSQTVRLEEINYLVDAEIGKENRQMSISSPMTFLPGQANHHHGKMVVVLDIDETLVHSQVVQRVNEQDAFNPEVFYLHCKDGVIIRVLQRPLLRDFLVAASQSFELIAFTAGAEEYASGLLDRIDPTGAFFTHRLYRQHCTIHGTSILKDLNILNRNLARTVLVDNSSRNFLLQLDNGVPISSFFDDARDTALFVLYNFLDKLKHEQDVRFELAKSFKLRAKFMNCIRKQQRQQHE
jgi:CTD small phosphatase-like protein 2